MTTANLPLSKRLYASHTMIEFIEETHTYLVDGVITPSVTTLIHEIWMPSMYKGINSDTLKRAASYGTKVHEMIEKWNKLPVLANLYRKTDFCLFLATLCYINFLVIS